MAAPPKKEPTDSDDGGATPEKKNHDAFERVTLATTILGVIILCIYTGLTGYQAYIAKDTAERQLRAYISATVERHPDIMGSDSPEFVMIFKNHGQTPAFKVHTWAGMVFDDIQLTAGTVEDSRAKFNQLPEEGSILFPGAEFRIMTAPGGIDQFGLTTPLTDLQKNAVRLGWRAVWIYGEVTYIDVYGIDRFTRFRLFMSGEYMVRVGKFFWAKEGNQAN